jgi:hypothetical protein
MGLLDPAAPLAANSVTATQQQLPGWYNDFLTGLSARGIDVASRPYTPYDGARVVGSRSRAAAIGTSPRTSCRR